MKKSDFLKRRGEKTASILENNRIDALLLTNLTNISYLSGFSGSNAYLLLTPKAGILFTDFRYKEAAANEVFGYEIEIYKESLLKNLCNRLAKAKIKRLGFEALSLTYSQYADLKKEAKGIKLIPTKNLIEDLRAVKDDFEITLIKKAASIIDNVMRDIRSQIKEGISERETAGHIEYLMRRHGADRSSFETIVAFGANSSKPHAKITDQKLKTGYAVLIDIGCSAGGYSSDLTRTFFLNSMNVRQKKVYRAVLEAQERAIDAVKAGTSANAIDKEARSLISAKGLGKRFGHALGHGVGMEVHESPRISSKSDVKLKTGMVFTVEPGIYIPGWGGVRIEDMVLVTDSGCEILTKSPKDIEEAII